MAGHMGDERVTTQNLRIVQVRSDDNVILLSGSVPGCKTGIITVRPALKHNQGL
jgi:large subunit ribosomal protein L3